MKIDAKKLQTFVEKATLRAGIPSAIIRTDKKKKTLSIWVKSVDNADAVNATLKNIDNDGSVLPIKSTKLLIDSLKLFQGLIELKQDGNKLSIFNKERQVDIVLAEESFIDNDLTKKLELPYDKKVAISTSIFKNALKNKLAVGAETMVLETDGKTFNILTGSKNFDAIKESTALPYDVAKVQFGKPLDDVLQILDDKVEMGLKTDFPVTLKEDTAEYEITYVIAPIVDNEE